MSSESIKTDKPGEKKCCSVTTLESNPITHSSTFSSKIGGDNVFENKLPEEQIDRGASDEEATFSSLSINKAASSDISDTTVLNGMQMNASTSSAGSTESTVSCRICKGHGGKDLVVSPCNCKGSMGVVHISCLEQWLTGSVRDSCELCSVPFNVLRTLKYSCPRSLCVYIRNQVSFPRLFRDLFFLSVSFMNTSILLYMWLAYVFRDIFTLISHGDMMGKSVATNPFRGVLYLFFFTLCLVFVFLNTLDDFRRVLHFYILPWYHWWQSSVDVKLVVHQNTANKQKQD